MCTYDWNNSSSIHAYTIHELWILFAKTKDTLVQEFLLSLMLLPNQEIDIENAWAIFFSSEHPKIQMSALMYITQYTKEIDDVEMVRAYAYKLGFDTVLQYIEMTCCDTHYTFSVITNKNWEWLFNNARGTLEKKKILNHILLYYPTFSNVLRIILYCGTNNMFKDIRMRALVNLTTISERLYY
jgi:hypothetical protein